MKSTLLCRALFCLLAGAFPLATIIAQSEGTPTQSLAQGPYIVTPAVSSASCMDSGGTNATYDTVYQCSTDNSNQWWQLMPVTGSAGNGYQIITKSSNKCLDVSGASNQSGANVLDWQCGDGNKTNQVWQFIAFGSSYELVSLNSGLCLNLPNNSTSNGNQLVQAACGQGNTQADLWNLSSISQGSPVTNLPAGPYTITPIFSTANCMNVNGGSTANGTAVQTNTCNGTSAQFWTFVPISGSHGSGYQIKPQNSGSCLEVNGASVANGATSDEHACAGAEQYNQIWQLYPYGSGYEIYSLNSARCLNLTGDNPGDGTQLIQYSCGSSNRDNLWVLNATQAVATSTSLQANTTAPVTGQTVNLTAQVTASVNGFSGNVTFLDGSTTLGTSSISSSGIATLSTRSLANGSHSIKASYAGSGNYGGSTSSAVTVTVAEPTSGEQAYQADAFVDSVGVATHLAYTDTAYYNNWSQILSALQTLGVRHVRDGYYPWSSTDPIVIHHQALATAGIGTTYVVPTETSATAQSLENFAAEVHDMDALESPNECDAGSNCGGGGTTGINNAVALLPTLQAAGQNLGKPVLGPSFTQASAYTTAGNIASKITYNNLHVYFGGRNPEVGGWGDGDAQGHGYGSLAWWIDQGNVDAPNVPDIITETGYMALSSPSPYQIPQSVQASYTPRTLLFAFNNGIKRSFIYELLDETSSPNYGLLSSDLSSKPAFTAVKTLLLLASDPGAAFTPGKLSYTLTGGDSTLNHTLLQKRDGTFWLILWLGQSSYNQANNTATTVAAQNVTLQLNGPAVADQTTRFDPTGTATASAISGGGTNLSLSVTDQLLAVHITPP